LNFDGVDDWVDCGSGSDFNSSTLTYSFWYKSSFGSIQCLATKYKDDNNKLQICSNYVGVKEGSWKQQISLPGGAFDGSWHHLTVVAGTSGVYVYYDGVLTGSDGTSSDLSFLDDSVVEIGRMTAGYPFNGQIDDVRVYNYALTPLQIKTLYNDGAVRFGE
jgi:hypothetical protein